jgi:nucleoside-diphosphate-sugar epimerase
MDKVFITGTSGYIGGSILAALVNRGTYQITAVVRCLESIPKDVAEKITLVQGDIYDLEFVRQTVKGHNVVIHTVKAGGLENDFKLIQVLGEEARYATRDRQGAFIYASGIYSCGSGIDCEQEEIHEDMPAPSMTSWGRKPLEEAALTFATFNLSVSVVRPGWVFGGHLKERSWVQDYIDYCKKHSVIGYHGDLKTLLPTIHVNDLVDLYMNILDHRYHGVYNGSDKSHSLEQLLQILSDHTKLPIKEIADEEFKKMAFVLAMDRSLSVNAGNLYAQKTGWSVKRPFGQSLSELFE